MTKNALLYVRVSTTDQALGYGLERQIDHGEKYVTGQGWFLEGIISDEGKSAFHGKNRLLGSSLGDFEAATLAGKNKGKVLVVENIDRLSREGHKAAIQLIWKLNENGVDVATTHDGKLYRADGKSDLLDLFVLGMTSARAYDESAAKSQRIKDSWTARYSNIANGEKINAARAPAWIDKTPDGYVLNEYRAAIINEIFDLYIGGEGIYKIVQRLNERGEPGWAIRTDKETGELKPDKGWYLAYVHRLLTHRAVLGEYVTLKGETLSASYFPPAVTADKFRRVANTLAGKRGTGGRRTANAANLLNGMVRCAKCNGTAAFQNKEAGRASTYTTKAGEVRSYFHRSYQRLSCDNHRRRKGCDNATIMPYEVVENAVLDRVLSMAIEDNADDPRLIVMRNQIAELERLIAANQSRMGNFLDAIGEGGSKALMSRVTALEGEIARQEAELDELVWNSRELAAKPTLSSEREAIAGLRDSLQSDDMDVRYNARFTTNLALKRIVEGVLINEGDTFAVWTDLGVWEFDKAGTMTGGQAI